MLLFCQVPKSRYTELIFNLEINSKFYKLNWAMNYLTKEECLQTGWSSESATASQHWLGLWDS